MSVKVQSLIWEYAPYRGNTLLAFLALGDWSDDEGYCWPKMKSLAKKSRQSVRNAGYAIEVLCRDGFLAVDIQPGRGHQNDFRINLQKLQVLASENLQNATTKPAKRNTKTCKTRQRNKEEPSLDPSVEPSGKSLDPISSSDLQSRILDDDTEFQIASLEQFQALPHDFREQQFPLTDVDRVLAAFDESPIVARASGATDRSTALKMLQIYSYAEIERGIVLATARRLMTDANQGFATKAASLSYFVGAINEARSDSMMTDSYIDRCRGAIKR